MNTRLMTISVASILIATVMSGSGCRPGDTTLDGHDTTTVIVVEEFSDTLVGVWDTDTLSTSTDILLVHQE
ncbi:MAG: hypothetical protein KAT09_08640, partial [Candidatus Aegiribacteria sp.]|nr:hypothetical protein [Candidatus Aegiribacteria sp.]